MEHIGCAQDGLKWILKVFNDDKEILCFEVDSIESVGSVITELNKARGFLPRFEYRIEKELFAKR